MEESQKELEDVIGKLRVQLKDSQEKNAQLTRQIDILKMELNDMEESNTRVTLELPEPESKPLMLNNNPEANASGPSDIMTKTVPCISASTTTKAIRHDTRMTMSVWRTDVGIISRSHLNLEMTETRSAMCIRITRNSARPFLSTGR